MKKEINIVYSLPETLISYDGVEGKISLSKFRNDSKINTFIEYIPENMIKPNDNFLLLEPIVTSQSLYNPSYLERFNKIFTPFYKVFENTHIKEKIVPINCGSMLIPDSYKNFINQWLPWEERINGIVMFDGGKNSSDNRSIYSIRYLICNNLHSQGFTVAKYGRRGNANQKYCKGLLYPEEKKIETLCKYRFALCPENTYSKLYSHDYLTEKLPHAILGGTIPLYIGCYNIDDFLPKNSFIDLREFVKINKNRIDINYQDIINKLKSTTKEDFAQYNKLSREYINNPKGLFYHTDIIRVYKTMLNSF